MSNIRWLTYHKQRQQILEAMDGLSRRKRRSPLSQYGRADEVGGLKKAGLAAIANRSPTGMEL